MRAAEPRPFAVALGGNVGSTQRIFREAIRALEARLGPLEKAPIFRSEPVSPVPQREFLNTVVTGRTRMNAESLLRELQAVETQFGRRREPGAETASPRTLDLDLLYLGKLVRRVRTPLLPHPRMRERRFVLAPLAAIAPDFSLPPDGATPRELLARLAANPWVRPLTPLALPPVGSGDER